MNPIEKPVAAADQFQQRRPWLALPVAVWKKFSDDQASNLAALIAYYGFAAIFPLLLVLVTILNMTLKDNSGLRHRLLNSALAQYPLIGNEIRGNLGSISGTGLPLFVGIVLLVFGARGVAGAMQNAICRIWGIPRDQRPEFPFSIPYQVILMLVVGAGLLLTSFLSGLAGGAGNVLSGVVAHVGAVAVSLIVNIGVFWLAFWLAAARRVAWRNLRIGAVAAAIVWQILQLAGGYVVSHELHRASSLYGTFGVVLGLLVWLHLQAEATLYAAEIDVVVVRRLWPRSLKSDDTESSPQKAGIPA